MERRRILIIDDDRDIWQAYQRVLLPVVAGDSMRQIHEVLALPDEEMEQSGFVLTFASQGKDGFEKVRQAQEDGSPFALAFIDVRMPPGWDGMETAAQIRKFDPDLELVIVTAYSDHSCEEIVRAVGSGTRLLFFRKPFDPEELKQLALSLTDKWLLARLAEQQHRDLINSEYRFRSLVETTNDFVWEVDREGRFTYCSPVCRELYGYEPEKLLGQLFFEILVVPENKEHFRQLFADCVQQASRCRALERSCYRKNGELIHIESSGCPVLDQRGEVVGFRGIDRDITARKENEKERSRLEAQYRQAQKLEALGTLAGGIAHDLNNILTPIFGCCFLGKMELGQEHPTYSHLETIESCSQRAAELVRRILSFCRKQELNIQTVGLDTLIHDFSKMLKRLIREDIKLVFDLAPNLWSVNADPPQMEQILVNLIVNARDAMEGGGTITVRAANHNIPRHTLYDVDSNELAGDYVVLSVSDQGTGIDQKTLAMIFDPFFTTKEVGKGTGMGLAAVYGIVARHQGGIIVDSCLNDGTSFHIYLPRSGTEIKPEQAKPGSSALMNVGTETILLVEDDLEILQLLASALSSAGYTTLTASDGQAGLKVFEEENGLIDLLITDLVMPELGGKALTQAVRHRKQNLPVLFMTGHSFDIDLQKLASTPNTVLLKKPFTMENFNKAVRMLLDEKQMSAFDS